MTGAPIEGHKKRMTFTVFQVSFYSDPISEVNTEYVLLGRAWTENTHSIYRVSVLGIVIMGLGRYLVFGYLDP